jgi:hypothetical protein
LGVEQPATDFIFWAFEQVPQNAARSNRSGEEG